MGDKILANSRFLKEQSSVCGLLSFEDIFFRLRNESDDSYAVLLKDNDSLAVRLPHQA